MKPASLALLLVACLSAILAAAQTSTRALDPDFVELDVVVVDGKGRPVQGLTRADFSVRDSGKTVDVGIVREVSGPQPGEPDAARTIVVLMDDTGVASAGTQTVQIVARSFLDRAAAIDDVPVVRLHARQDEPYGDRIESLTRIGQYRGGAHPFDDWSVIGDVFDRLSEIAGHVSANTARRRLVVCVGSPLLCNAQEPSAEAPRAFAMRWEQAVADAARANVAFYAFVPGRTGYRGGGLPEATGGEVLASSYDVAPAIDHILQDASNYYLVGYFAPSGGDRRGLHPVDVKVRRKGVKVRTRKQR